MSRQTDIADLLRKAGNAQSTKEAAEFVRQAEVLKSEAIDAKRASNDYKAEQAFIRDNLVPAGVHELPQHAASTDWLAEIDTSYDSKQAAREMVAEASLWFGRVNEDVKPYADEYAEQAKNVARKLAGKYGDEADNAEQSFTAEADRLRATAVRAGLIVEATDDTMAPEESATPDDDPDAGMYSQSSRHYLDGDDTGFWNGLEKDAASGLPEVGQQGYPEQTAFPAQNGNLPPEATSSNRAPQLQELEGTPSQDVVPANDPGLQKQEPFPVSGNQKESSMSQSLPRIGDIAKFAASGLDQIEQTADPKDNPKPANQLSQGVNTDVAFQWTMNPAQQIPAAVNQAEQQIKERNAKSPLASQSNRTAGRDNSGWIGDMGGRGTDYPGEQAPTGDMSTSEGYQDPVYGYGGDQGNQQLLPYGHQEADDTTNKPRQWQVGQPTQMDQGWRETVASNQNLQAALEYVNQHYAAYKRNG